MKTKTDVDIHSIRSSIYATRIYISKKDDSECVPDQNHRNDAAHEEDHHERVHDRKPMNVVFEKLIVKITIEAVLVQRIRLDPLYRIRKIKCRTCRIERNENIR